MINIFSACTDELDNPAKAVLEILTALNLNDNLLKNSAAIVFCHSKFIEAGIASEICEHLPPCTIGCSSQFIAIPSQAGELVLTVTVLTSDDTEFSAGVSGVLSVENVEENLAGLYSETAHSLSGEPSMVFAFPPTMSGDLSTDLIAGALNRACGETPIFGSFSLDMDNYIRNPRIMYRGESYNNRLAMLLVKSPVKPRFYCYPFPETLTFDQDIVVTDAEANLIRSINNIPAVTFMREEGIIPDNKPTGIQAIPLIAGDPDGKELWIVVVKGAGPDGELICTRQIKTGTLLNVGNVSAEFVRKSVMAIVKDIENNLGGSAVFIVSCFLRSVVLGGPPIDEFDMVRNTLDDFGKPYLFVSSGGELCPFCQESGEPVNSVYAYAIVACQF